MNPTPTAAEALEAAERWNKHNGTDLYPPGCVMRDFILANKDLLLSLPTPGASTSAERAEPKEPDEPLSEREMLDWTRDAIRKWNADPKCSADPLGVQIIDMAECLVDCLADALNAPAAAPVAMADLAEEFRKGFEAGQRAAAPAAGLFEGGISWAFEVIGRGGFARNEEFADGRAMGMNPPHEMAYLYRDGIPFEPINIDLYDARCTTWVECDRHGLPLAVPAPTAGGEG